MGRLEHLITADNISLLTYTLAVDIKDIEDISSISPHKGLVNWCWRWLDVRLKGNMTNYGKNTIKRYLMNHFFLKNAK